MNEKKLWTKDFTIITVGSIVSLFGSALSTFAISLMVLDYTQSSLLYAIYIVLYTAPQLLAPIVSGAILDRFSRKKTIYTLDFISSATYLVAALFLGTGHFNFAVLAVFSLLVGTNNAIYMVAYESFYPLLITEGFYSKAYSISSVLETTAIVMIPVSAYVYNQIGIVPLLVIDAASFFIAAVMETRIGAHEDYVDRQKETWKEESSKMANVLMDIKEGFRYLWSEKGLLFIAIYFTFVSFTGGAEEVVVLPYFKGNYANGEYIYMLVMVWAVIGRGIGGAIHYKIKMPKNKKFLIAMITYCVCCIGGGLYLFCPLPVMGICLFIEGIGGITTYTIRASATQGYVPDERKGRFNGAFNVLNTAGSLLGETLAGLLTVSISTKYVLLLFYMMQLFALFVIIGGNRKHVAPIYNTEQ